VSTLFCSEAATEYPILVKATLLFLQCTLPLELIALSNEAFIQKKYVIVPSYLLNLHVAGLLICKAPANKFCNGKTTCCFLHCMQEVKPYLVIPSKEHDLAYNDYNDWSL